MVSVVSADDLAKTGVIICAFSFAVEQSYWSTNITRGHKWGSGGSTQGGAESQGERKVTVISVVEGKLKVTELQVIASRATDILDIQLDRFILSRKVSPKTCKLPHFVGTVFTNHVCFNTLRPRQNGRHFTDNNFKTIFLNENCCMLIQISLKYVSSGPVDNKPHWFKW